MPRKSKKRVVDGSEDVRENTAIAMEVAEAANDAGSDSRSETEEEAGAETARSDGLDGKRQHVKSRRSALPTLEEQSHLRATQNLYRSNLLKLQVEELLRQTRLSSGDREDSERKFLFELREVLQGLASAKLTSSEGIPLVHWDTKRPPELAFRPPKKVGVVGSYMLKTMTKPLRGIDLAVEVPDECLERKDYMNYRYTDKRKLFLATMAKGLRKYAKHLVEEVCFSGFVSDVSKPVLLIYPTATTGLFSTVVKILPTVSETVFPMQRFRPDQSNVRPLQHFDEEIAENRPTPNYNMSILEDVAGSSFMTHLSLLHELRGECDSFEEVCCLIKVWARVRGFSREASSDVPNEFFLIMLFAHSLLEKIVSPSLSPQQSFRNFMGFIAKADLGNKVWRMRKHMNGGKGKCWLCEA